LVAGNGACHRAKAKEQGCDTAAILAQEPEEIKGQNDLPQLPVRMPEIRKDSQWPARVSLLSML